MELGYLKTQSKTNHPQRRRHRQEPCASGEDCGFKSAELGGFAYPSPVRIRTTLKAEAALVCAVAPDCAALTAWSGSLHRAALSEMASVGQLEARARVVGNLLWPPSLRRPFRLAAVMCGSISDPKHG